VAAAPTTPTPVTAPVPEPVLPPEPVAAPVAEPQPAPLAPAPLLLAPLLLAPLPLAPLAPAALAPATGPLVLLLVQLPAPAPAASAPLAHAGFHGAGLVWPAMPSFALSDAARVDAVSRVPAPPVPAVRPRRVPPVDDALPGRSLPRVRAVRAAGRHAGSPTLLLIGAGGIGALLAGAGAAAAVHRRRGLSPAVPPVRLRPVRPSPAAAVEQERVAA
jgi:hypothetical protein